MRDPFGHLWSRRDLNKLPRQLVDYVGAQGKTHKMVAVDLGTSPATVRNQTQAIYAKLDIRNRTDLAKLLARSL